MKTAHNILLIFCITFWLPLSAQVNLVPNPGFEDYNNCPTSIANIPYEKDSFPTVKQWFRPTTASPDYFNGCSNPNLNCGVPQNMLSGNSPAHGGKAYVGILGLYSPRANYREYVTTKLIKPLQTGQVYAVSFYVWLGKGQALTDGLVAISSLGCALTKHFNYSNSTILSISPQIENKNTRFLNDTTQWMEITGYYKAQGGEQFLTIGNFRSDSLTTKESLIDPANIAYYLVDDVSVVKINTSGFHSDTTLCAGDSIIGSMRPAADSCVWEDGSKQSPRTLNKDGIYRLTNYFNSSYSIIDTFEVHVINPATSNITDTSACNASSMKLKAQKAYTYLWNTNRTTQSISITKSGTYWVKRSTPSCMVTDTFRVKIFSGPTIPYINDTGVCFDQVQEILLDAGTYEDYLWRPTKETTRYILSSKAQPYLLTVTDSNNCSISKQFEVYETCPDYLFVPNAFTPNGDGLNDIFLPQSRSLIEYEMQVVNKWGQVVFSTHDTSQGWDGFDAPSDVYVVHFNYKVQGKSKQQSYSQNITLLK